MAASQISALTDHLGYWMRMVSNHVSQSFAQKLEATGVTVAEWVILREMYEHHEAISPGSLVQSTGLSKGAVSKLVERLLQKKLVSRTGAKEDRRFQEIRLTPSGRALVPRLARLADQNDDECFSSLARAEKKQLESLLRKLATMNQLSAMPTE